MEQKLNLILDELQKLNTRVATLEENMSTIEDNMATKDDISNMATKDDVSDIALIKQAVLETNQEVKQVLSNQKSIHEVIGEHEVSIRTLRRKPV